MPTIHIDDIMKMADEELGKKLRRDLVDWEAARIPNLHQKYRKLLFHEKVELERMKLALEPLLNERRIYYGGKDTPEAYKAKQFDLKLDPKGTTTVTADKKKKQVIKSELSMFVDADPAVIEARELVNQQAEKVSYITDLFKNINQRSFNLSLILNTQRFKAGLDKLEGGCLDLTDPDADGDD